MTLKERKSSDKLIDRLGLVSIRNRIQNGRHIERMEKESWVKKCQEIVVEGRGRDK